MKVLVTGHRGKLGSVVYQRLREAGFEVSGYDLADGRDLLDARALRSACEGQQVVANCAGQTLDRGTAWGFLRVNVLGMARLLAAADTAGVSRLVHAGSGHALGILLGEGHPDYFPIDDAHPRRPRRPYALSRALAETLCARSSRRGGPATVCLRFPVLLDEAELAARRAELVRRPSHEAAWWWDYGAFIHLDDAAEGVVRAVQMPFTGHHRLMLCADEVAAVQPDALSLATRLYPKVPIIDPDYFHADPARPLFDTRAAKRLLGWQPRHRWRR